MTCCRLATVSHHHHEGTNTSVSAAAVTDAFSEALRLALGDLLRAHPDLEGAVSDVGRETITLDLAGRSASCPGTRHLRSLTTGEIIDALASLPWALSTAMRLDSAPLGGPGPHVVTVGGDGSGATVSIDWIGARGGGAQYSHRVTLGDGGRRISASDAAARA